MWLFNVFLDCHQTFIAGFLENVEHQRHQFHVACFGVLAAFKALAQSLDGGLHYLGLVVGEKGTNGCAANRDHFKGQGVQDHHDVATVKDVDAKDAHQYDQPADDYEHRRIVTGKRYASKVEITGF